MQLLQTVSFMSGDWQVLAHPQLLEATKNKDSGLTFTKVWGNHDLERRIDEIYLLRKTSLSRSEEVAVLSTVQKPTQSIKGNEVKGNCYK